MEFEIETKSRCPNCELETYQITIVDGKIVCKRCKKPITSDLEIEVQ